MSTHILELSEKVALRRSKYFFDHSKICLTANERLAATSFQNSPFGLKH
jgi:hypothetical protein